MNKYLAKLQINENENLKIKNENEIKVATFQAPLYAIQNAFECALENERTSYMLPSDSSNVQLKSNEFAPHHFTLSHMYSVRF